MFYQSPAEPATDRIRLALPTHKTSSIRPSVFNEDHCEFSGATLTSSRCNDSRCSICASTEANRVDNVCVATIHRSSTTTINPNKYFCTTRQPLTIFSDGVATLRSWLFQWKGLSHQLCHRLTSTFVAADPHHLDPVATTSCCSKSSSVRYPVTSCCKTTTLFA